MKNNEYLNILKNVKKWDNIELIYSTVYKLLNNNLEYIDQLIGLAKARYDYEKSSTCCINYTGFYIFKRLMSIKQKKKDNRIDLIYYFSIDAYYMISSKITNLYTEVCLNKFSNNTSLLQKIESYEFLLEKMNRDAKKFLMKEGDF